MFGSAVTIRPRTTFSEKLVRVSDIERITDAVLIGDISVNGQSVECGLFVKPPDVLQPITTFQAGSDWLRQMTITLINRTDKVIAFGSINLSFLDTGDCRAQPCASAYLKFGHLPSIDAYDGRTGRPLKPEDPEKPSADWKPEESRQIHVSDYTNPIEQRLSDFMTPTRVAKLNIYRGDFFFDDGMRWALGRFAVPEADRPGKFKELPADYFPGKRGHNWPPGYNN